MSFSASAADAARIESDGLTFAGTDSFPSLAELALREDGSVVLAVRRGTVSVGNLRPEPVVVAAGHYLVVGPPTAKEEGQVVGTGAHAKQTLGDKLRTFRIGGLSHTASAAFVVGALGGVTAAAIAIPLATSPAKASPSTP